MINGRKRKSRKLWRFQEISTNLLSTLFLRILFFSELMPQNPVSGRAFSPAVPLIPFARLPDASCSTGRVSFYLIFYINKLKYSCYHMQRHVMKCNTEDCSIIVKDGKVIVKLYCNVQRADKAFSSSDELKALIYGASTVWYGYCYIDSVW